jgi:hypothetical protein
MEDKEMLSQQDDNTPTAEDQQAMAEIQAGMNELEAGADQTDDDEFSADQLEDIDMDFSAFGKDQLINHFKKILSHTDLNKIKDVVENIRTQFYRRLKEENEEKRKKFVEEGNKIEDFSAEEDALEIIFKELYKGYKEKKAETTRIIDEENKQNLSRKKAIIESIKELINKPESLNDTFEEFRRLRTEWNETGLVPQSEVKALYENYQHANQLFYDWVKLNREAMEEDLKRNLDAKMDLCEKAEHLLLETDVKRALSDLKILHERWREIGPVKRDASEEVWQRFREASIKIYKSHQEFFLKKKEEFETNFKAKTMLCEKAEEISSQVYTRRKDWEKATSDMLEIQKVWRTIGTVPRGQSQMVFKRFRDAFQAFFDNKKNYYEGIMGEEMANLQKKLDLCIQAEQLSESNDWKRTTEQLIGLQKKWKTIGAIPRKNSEEVWNRFRAACNKFFERKQTHFSSLGEMVNEHISKKQELIKKVKEYELTGDVKADLRQLKFFQNDWAETGQVPAGEKEKLLREFRAAINEHFEKMRLDDSQKESLQFRVRIDEILASPNPRDNMNKERNNLITRLRTLENDIKLWENNIGFFSKSSSADKMLAEFHKKIEQGKVMAETLKKKIKMIDEIKI